MSLRATRDWKMVFNRTPANRRAPQIVLPQREEGPAGVFEFPGVHAVVPQGYRSEWWTAALEPPK
jgi:hypothetical protein